jgi:hypothetical protein
VAPPRLPVCPGLQQWRVSMASDARQTAGTECTSDRVGTMTDIHNVTWSPPLVQVVVRDDRPITRPALPAWKYHIKRIAARRRTSRRPSHAFAYPRIRSEPPWPRATVSLSWRLLMEFTSNTPKRSRAEVTPSAPDGSGVCVLLCG